MRHWSQLAIRNWQGKRVRALGAAAAIALGTAAVVWVTCCYESVRRTVLDYAAGYIGHSHVMVSSPLGKYDQIPERLVDTLKNIPNVSAAVPMLVQRLRAKPRLAEDVGPEKTPERWTEDTDEFDLLGIDPDLEPLVRDHTSELTEGSRLLTAEDDMVCLLEANVAIERGMGPGDYLLVWPSVDSLENPFALKIVGLFERPRVMKFQKAAALLPLRTLQRIRSKFALITQVDLVLEKADRDAVRATAEQVRRKVRVVSRNATIRTSESRMRQIELAQAQQHFVLALLSCVAMLTALFIILSTLSMGMIERIGQLGLLRCIGMTRGQLATLVLAEVVPLGAVGILSGIPIGLGLTVLTVWLVPDYVGKFAISQSGIAMAAGAGFATTLLAGLLPAIAALRVSPMEAARPRARRPHAAWLAVVAVLAIGTLLIQHYVVVESVQRSIWFVQMAGLGVIVLYLGYALLSGPAVRLIGSPAVVVAAWLLRVRTRLLQDQVGHAVWRSAGICCGLMVGLSLIVGIVSVNESVTRGWEFPKQFPEAYVWSLEQLAPAAQAGAAIARVPGIKEFTLANAVNVIVEERPPAMLEQVVTSSTWFLGCEPDTFLDLIKVQFLEGDEKTAREQLRKGGYILIADDFARSRKKGVVERIDEDGNRITNTVRIYYGTTTVATFKVAGVVRSPALDIAASFFQLLTEYNVAASGSVIGTNEDLKRRFGADGTKLALMNFDIPAEPVPPDWPPPEGSAGQERAEVTSDYYDTSIPVERRWRRWQQEQVLREVRAALSAPQAQYGTVAELKGHIDNQLTRMTRLLTAVPGVALIVAALGVANLMTANVTSRARQIAMLRAVGATRGLILRMVVGEAIVLGLLGSALGLALGVHLAENITQLVDAMWGFRVSLQLPWALIVFATVLTVTLCVIAGLLPARHASRTNIVDALHVT